WLVGYFAIMPISIWNRDVGEVWSSVLRRHHLERATVMEIAPGFSDKIAFGLAALRFRGTMLLVEPNAAARQWAVERYRLLLPRATVVPVAERVRDVRVSHRIDALLANHVLDDLLLDALAPPALCTPLFSTMFPDASCSPMFIETWRQVRASSPRID